MKEYGDDLRMSDKAKDDKDETISGIVSVYQQYGDLWDIK
jgi:hypothetical protein